MKIYTCCLDAVLLFSGNVCAAEETPVLIENEEDFNCTLNNLSGMNISKVHVFPYSKRKGTPAYEMPNQIEEAEKKNRAKKIQDISDKKHLEFLKRNVLTENEIIIEKNRDKKTNLLKGVTKNYINILIDDSDKYKDTLQKVLITGFSADKEKLTAKIVT